MAFRTFAADLGVADEAVGADTLVAALQIEALAVGAARLREEALVDVATAALGRRLHLLEAVLAVAAVGARRVHAARVLAADVPCLALVNVCGE